MMKNLKLRLGFAMVVLTTISFAQNVHFSQSEYAPGTLNPATTGAYAPLQANVNYRTQWSSIAVPYTSIAASVEARFNDKKRQKKGIIAGGINFYNDSVGNLSLTTSKVNLNLAYHLILDRTSTLGIGLYSGFGQRTLLPANGQWGNQYDGMAYDENLPSNETFNSSQFSYFDVGTGLVYSYKSTPGRASKKMVTGGIAFYHVNNPNYSFINNEDEKLPLRWSVFVNSSFALQNSNGAIMPALYFNRQKSNMEILYGAYYQFSLGDPSQGMNFGLGVFHRWGDALIAKTYFEIKDFKAGLAYDFNLSSLSEVSKGRGGAEFFLQYRMSQKRGTRSSI